MIRYALEDSDGSYFELTGVSIAQPTRGSVTISGERFNYDNKIIENSSIPGATLIGDPRLASSSIDLIYVRVHDNINAYMLAENALLVWLKKTVAIRDITNSRRLYVTIDNIEIRYDDGSLKLSSENRITFKVLKPFWEKTTVTTIGGSCSIGSNTFPFTNDGSLKTYPRISINTSVAVDDIEVYVDSTKHGIIVQDSIFGTSGFTNLYIDCKLGTVEIYDGADFVDITPSILGGTGFFFIQPGSDDLKVIVSAACSVSMAWQIRNYV